MKYEVTERAEILLKEEVKIVRISVRDLVEFVLREGDIDNRKIGMSDKDVMAMGGRLHRKIQRQMGSDYHAETAMKLQIPCGEFDLRVEGRADGVIIKGDTSEVIIDEIKGILRDLSLNRTAGECPSLLRQNVMRIYMQSSIACVKSVFR